MCFERPLRSTNNLSHILHGTVAFLVSEDGWRLEEPLFLDEDLEPNSGSLGSKSSSLSLFGSPLVFREDRRRRSLRRFVGTPSSSSSELKLTSEPSRLPEGEAAPLLNQIRPHLIKYII